jgi:hypothetical protein
VSCCVYSGMVNGGKRCALDVTLLSRNGKCGVFLAKRGVTGEFAG